MVGMAGQERRNQDRGVEEPFHRDFFRRGRRVGRLPMKLSSRSRRIWRRTSSVAPAGIGSPPPNTPIPCFLGNPTPPLRGRSTMRSSELSSSSESPARSCISSRTGLGRTTRPALSSVKVVVMTPLYNGICHYKIPFHRMLGFMASFPFAFQLDNRTLVVSVIAWLQHL